MYKYTTIRTFYIYLNFYRIQFVCADILSNITKNEYLCSPKRITL